MTTEPTSAIVLSVDTLNGLNIAASGHHPTTYTKLAFKIGKDAPWR
jgi:hypothetical protein